MRQEGTWQSSMRYVAGLDGLRAIAVLAVLGYHLFPGVAVGGYIGVDLFFVISGFLITLLLITEHTRSGRLELRRFWVRRARRLWPALGITIAVASAAALFVRGDILVGLGRQIFGALTFSNNWVEVLAGANYFDANNTHLFTNFWSLAVEEQFYLFWPFVVLGLLKLRRPGVGVLACLLLAAGSSLAMAYLFNGDNATRVYYGTDTHIFGLMLGASLAFWAYARLSVATLRRLYQPLTELKAKPLVEVLGWVALAGFTVLLFKMPETSPLTYQGGLVLASILAAVVLVATISFRGLLQRLFSLRPLAWLGARSYGIYLWHWPLLVLLTHTLPTTIAWWIVPLTVTVATLLIAALSYKYVELPVRRLGLRAFLAQGIRRRAVVVDNVITAWKIRPHPMLVSIAIIVGLAVAAVLSAPSKTQAQLRIEAGQSAIQKAAHQASNFSTPQPTISVKSPSPAHATTQPITGTDITVVGDSVTLASAPALQTRFPGIDINAEISRSMRRGGLETIDNMLQAKQLRPVVVVALATNGYFGTGNLDMLVGQLGDRRIVFVTAHVDREWTGPNNDDLHALAKKYPNVKIAEWNDAIGAHPEDLGPDGIHPTAAGGPIYADCIAAALTQFK